MKDVILKITSLGFILLWLTPLLLSVSFHLQQQVIRYSISKKMEHERLIQTISLPEDEVIWMDKHEILVNEIMFDIQSKELKNGVYTFKGVFDREETELVNEQNRNTGKDKDKHTLISGLFKLLQSPLNNVDTTTATFCSCSLKFTIFSPAFLFQLARKVPTPPPRPAPFILI